MLDWDYYTDRKGQSSFDLPRLHFVKNKDDDEEEEEEEEEIVLLKIVWTAAVVALILSVFWGARNSVFWFHQK